MARLKNIIHSEDACTMIFEGDKATPEPSTGIIKFPGGLVEVARTSNGDYWAHISATTPEHIKESRIDYGFEAYKEHGIPEIPAHDQIKHIAILIGKESTA